MSSRCRSSLGAALPALAAAVVLAGCQRESREFGTPDGGVAVQPAMTPLAAGQTDLALRAARTQEYAENAYQLSQGQQLYSAFNCVGCHAHGGGDVGPALMDDKWIYGGEIDQIYASIAQGRPNGMPSFAGLIPPTQIWQLAGYVRSLGGFGSKSARSGRSDHLRTPSPQDAIPVPPAQAQREDH